MGSLWLHATLQSPAPMPGFPKDLETHLAYRWPRWTPDLCGPQVSDLRECRQFVLYHVTSQLGQLATTHISTTFTMAQDILCYQGCRTDQQNETRPQRHRAFHLESFGLSLFSTVSGGAVATHCVSQTDMEKQNKTVVQRLSKFWSCLRVFCDGFEQLSSFNLI